jgi:hypothetical protein
MTVGMYGTVLLSPFCPSLRSSLSRLTIPLSAKSGSAISGARPLSKDQDSHGRFAEFPTVNPLKR